MTYTTKINPIEIGGFCLTSNLKLSVEPRTIKRVQTIQTQNGDYLILTEVIKMVKKYQHFNPKKYNIESKIASVKTSFHCKYNINYHIIWIPKYRKHLLKGKVKDVLKTIIEGVCYNNRVEMLALEIMPDHLHLFIGAKPTTTPSQLVKRLKGNTSIQLRRCFPFLKYLGYKKHYKQFKNLWARGYYCGSAGHVSQEQVKRYILEQEGKSPFEYNVFNAPKGQATIGDFTR